MAVDARSIVLDPTADQPLKDFSLVTLKERYLTPAETSPQQAFARACAAYADDEAHAQRLYDYVSQGWFMFATPLLSNAGTERGLSISCFLTSVPDSREGISDHYDEVIWLSSNGGGIGSYWNLRSAGEVTSKGSQSTGAMPFIAVDDRLILAVSQGGTRRGSEAVYMDIGHPEIMEFIVGRKTTGDQNRKFTNLHNAINITDDFMYAVRDDMTWHFRSPHTGEIRGEIGARELWKLIIETRMQTGEPYLHFVDNSNRLMQPAQKALGLKVTQSNLCVTGETEILTQHGYLPIAGLVDEECTVWNGTEWSDVTIRKTCESAELVRVWFDDGGYLDCTPQHNFYIGADDEESPTPAGLLCRGDVLQGSQASYPVIGDAEGGLRDARSNAIAYTAGWTTFAGFEDANRLATFVPTVTPAKALQRLTMVSVDSEADEDGMIIRFEPKTIDSGFVPLGAPLWRKRLWLSGALDAAGSWTEFDGDDYLVIGSTDVDTIREMRLLALECGIHSRVRLTDTMNVFMLHRYEAAKLSKSGESTQVVPYVPVKWRGPTVSDVHPLPYMAPTYCATEPKRGRLMFNGYLTGNCTEIMLHSGVDHLGKARTAVCCLSSVNAEFFPEWKDHPHFLEDLFRMLDNALQDFIDRAPPQMEKARYSAMMERSVGLGAFGIHSLFKRHDVAFESDEARRINKRLSSHIRREADIISLKLGAERGSPPDMEGTGERFAHKLAWAPNASSSIICRTVLGSGASPSSEPDRANAFLHKTLSGSFPVRDPYLTQRLIALGQDTPDVWQSIIANKGSVQHLDFLSDHDKAVYATAMEIDQRAVVRLAADRTDDICQGQSINLFFEHDADAGYLSETHWMAWDLGVKSLYYLRSTTPKRGENTNTLIERRATISMEEDLPIEGEECVSCQG